MIWCSALPVFAAVLQKPLRRLCAPYFSEGIPTDWQHLFTINRKDWGVILPRIPWWSILLKRGPSSRPVASIQASNNRTGQVSRLLPNGNATICPSPFWSVLLRTRFSKSPSRVFSKCSIPKETSSLLRKAAAQPITRRARFRYESKKQCVKAV